MSAVVHSQEASNVTLHNVTQVSDPEQSESTESTSQETNTSNNTMPAITPKNNSKNQAAGHTLGKFTNISCTSSQLGFNSSCVVNCPVGYIPNLNRTQCVAITNPEGVNTSQVNEVYDAGAANTTANESSVTLNDTSSQDKRRFRF